MTKSTNRQANNPRTEIKTIKKSYRPHPTLIIITLREVAEQLYPQLEKICKEEKEKENNQLNEESKEQGT